MKQLTTTEEYRDLVSDVVDAAGAEWAAGDASDIASRLLATPAIIEDQGTPVVTMTYGMVEPLDVTLYPTDVIRLTAMPLHEIELRAQTDVFDPDGQLRVDIYAHWALALDIEAEATRRLEADE